MAVLLEYGGDLMRGTSFTVTELFETLLDIDAAYELLLTYKQLRATDL